MTAYLLPVLFALFLWWASTVAIIWVDHRPRPTFPASMALGTLLAAVAAYGLFTTRGETGLAGVYIGFACGLTLWGWQLLSFYLGIVTGPRPAPCPTGAKGLKRARYAILSNLWHELASLAGGLLVIALVWDSPNQIGAWTYLILWWMHLSAKLNVFLGVRNLGLELIPEHLAFLKGYFTKKPMNGLFPVSVTVSTAITVLLVMAAIDAETVAAAAGLSMLSALMLLAILEHWLLVVPFDLTALWQIGVPETSDPAPEDGYEPLPRSALAAKG